MAEEILSQKFEAFRPGRRTIIMTTFLCGLAALCLSVGVTSQARAQEYIFTTDDPPGSNGGTASGINDDGEIVGQYRDASYNAHGFLATPVKLTP